MIHVNVSNLYHSIPTYDWLVVLSFNATLTTKELLKTVENTIQSINQSINQQLRSYNCGRRRTCVTWLSHTSNNTNSFPNHLLLISYASAEVRGENTPKKKFRLNRLSNLQPPSHESDTLTTEPPGRTPPFEDPE